MERRLDATPFAGERTRSSYYAAKPPSEKFDRGEVACATIAHIAPSGGFRRRSLNQVYVNSFCLGVRRSER